VKCRDPLAEDLIAEGIERNENVARDDEILQIKKKHQELINKARNCNMRSWLPCQQAEAPHTASHPEDQG
jgi:hypothetical protein